MPDITLVAETSREIGSRPTRRIRGEGKVPGVLYGHGVEPTSLSVNARELRIALSTGAGTNALLRLELDGGHHLAVAKELQRHPVRGNVTHVDFQVVGRHEQLTVEVPVNLIGEAEAVLKVRGLVDQETFSLILHAAADSIPESIDVDVSDLEVGDSIRLSDIKLPKNVTALGAEDMVIVVAQARQLADLPETEAGESSEGATEGSDSSAANSDSKADS